MAITAALGFDNFVVMRHGLPHDPATQISSSSSSSAAGVRSPPNRLGCYFCNDVVAPLNSTVDRTLDQQCTVARPGLAPIAGALAVELVAALLQHPLKGHAPAPGMIYKDHTAAAASSAGPSSSRLSKDTPDLAGALGPVPHMIRGQLSGFSQTCMVGQGFSQCTACSKTVVERYRSDGWGFVREVLAEPYVLEELTGLAELHRQAAAISLSDDDDDSSENCDTAALTGRAVVDGGAAAEMVTRVADEDDWTEL